ncbi:uncharacterized protein BP5553_04751 [Venustampulla echinocandica]|uniref:Uncharacterized protein n=1 Tax=Venustampulla echinocandica TaxID=2656787 RepID=A0A370TP90_9HELO|nr:uncharacterized protein BP5553_04751 [Venustampulla echinocandica]RDL37318.1 hypothetical protein BP5553_04751 [Venustampulla echinocandica]
MCSLASSSGARRYLAEELLSLRSELTLSKSVVDKLHKHPDIACIARRSEANTCNNHHLTRKQNIDYSGESENMFSTATQMAGDRQRPQWSFRRRDSSDRSSQPHSAPSDVAVQQSANFQRFYRAVVSPTHVRVTAGGRIVPNTRATGPPAFNLNLGNLTFGPKQPVHETEVNFNPSTPWQHAAPALPGYPPLIPGGFYSPFSNLPQGNSLAPATIAPQTGGCAGNDQNSLGYGQNSMLNADTFSNLQRPGGLFQPIKISPLAQSDRTKPFMYNGQMMYPLTPVPNSIPMGAAMLGSPNFLPQRFPCPLPGFGPFSHFPIPLTPLPNPLAIAPGQQLPIPIQPTMFPFPPPGLTRMPLLSQITKSQIQGLHAYLKLIDNHSENNENQADVMLMRLQRNTVLAQLKHMESMLEAQLAQESATTADLHRDGDANNKHTFAAQNRMPTFNSQSQNSARPNKQPLSYLPTDRNTEQRLSTAKDTQNEKAKETTPTARPWPVNKSRLTAAAAMAPPFQPRGQASTVEPPKIQPEMDMGGPPSPFEPVTFQTQAEVQRRLLSRASTSWEHPTLLSSLAAEKAAKKAAQNITRAESMQEQSVAQAHREEENHAVQRSATFHGQTEPSPPSPVPAWPVPYLVGAMPKEVPGKHITYTDLIYPRPLTDEEIRARCLYWGKEPISSGKGLPKFDGMDFYPPSPVKEMSHMVSHNDNQEGAVNVHRNAMTAPLPHFDQLFTESGATGYKSPQPIRPSTSHSSQASTPVQHHSRNSGLGIHVADNLSWLPRYPPHKEPGCDPVAPPYAGSNAGGPRLGDFSHLHAERGASGYRSPFPARPVSKDTKPGANLGRSELTVAANNDKVIEGSEDSNDENRSKGSWSMLATNRRWDSDSGNTTVAIEEAEEDGRSNNSIVEAHLTPRSKEPSSNSNVEGSFDQRVANFRNVEQQTLFLQNMLKNAETTQTMTGSVLSGMVSSATATGYLPHYHGSAVASLAPNTSNVSETEQAVELRSSKHDLSRDMVNPGADLLSENRPLTGARPQRRNHDPTGSMGAEGYLLLVSQKAEKDKKTVEQGWNANTTGAGPDMGSSW